MKTKYINLIIFKKSSRDVNPTIGPKPAKTG